MLASGLAERTAFKESRTSNSSITAPKLLYDLAPCKKPHLSQCVDLPVAADLALEIVSDLLKVFVC